MVAYLQSAAGSVALQHIILGGMMAALVTLVVFRLAQPYAFADRTIAREAYMAETGQEPSWLYETAYSIVGLNPRFRANLEEIQRLQAPEASFPRHAMGRPPRHPLPPHQHALLWDGFAGGHRRMAGL
ncbi:MAG: hypothetical protein IPL28_17520 [Chloroflexi bacterium]|nr:hypothetical protein [Chloroflexota bacterium]